MAGLAVLAGLAVPPCLSAAPALADTARPARPEPSASVPNTASRLSGLPVADAWLDAVMEGRSYTISSRFFSAGLAKLFVSMKADTHSTGQMAGGKAMPKTYAQDFVRGSKLRRYDIRFDKGNVTDFTIVPPRKTVPENWVAIEPEHLIAVQDPLAAMLRPGNADPCPARLPVFDGEMRFDLVLEPKRTDRFKAGYSGPAEVCTVRFEPKSGFRKGREDVDYVSRLKAMEIWFVRIEPLNAWAPVRLTVPTRYGELKVLATKLGN